MSDPFSQSSRPELPHGSSRRRRRPAVSRGGDQVQVVPLAASARRRPRVLRPPRRAADGRDDGFDPEAWCPDCAFFKLRRTPKKRSPTTTGTERSGARRSGLTQLLGLASLSRCRPYSENSFASSTHSPCGASCW